MNALTALRVVGPVLSAAMALGAQTLAGPPVLPSPLHHADAGVPITTLFFDADAYAAIKAAGSATLVGFPLPGGAIVDLEVSPIDIFADGAHVVVASAEGEVLVERPDLVLLSGSVSGEPGSRVYLSLSPDSVNGYVIREGSTYVLSSGPRNQGQMPVIYDPAAVPPELLILADAPCGTDALPLPPGADLRPMNPGGGGPSGRSAPCREVRIAIETDWEYCGNVFGGDTVAAAAYAATLVGAVSEIYKSEFNTSLKISFLRTWASNTDPYIAGDIGTRLSEFQTHWNRSMFLVQRQVAHIISGSGGGGVAYLPGVCNGGYAYGASGNIGGYFPYPIVNYHGQNWDPFVVAHEIGHNFGAPHTHSTTPPIDNCGNGDCRFPVSKGTIMSYCHTCVGGMTNIEMSMHPRIIDEFILPYLGGLVCNIGRSPASITNQPDSQTVQAGQPASVSVTATGTGTLSYQWYKEGAPIAGATASTYSWTPAMPGDAGSYTVRVVNLCGSVESDPAVLTVTTCPADYNGDGYVDGVDYDLFNIDYESYDLGQQMNADYNGDGFVDGIDYDLFHADFEAGC